MMSEHYDVTGLMFETDRPARKENFCPLKPGIVCARTTELAEQSRCICPCIDVIKIDMREELLAIRAAEEEEAMS